MGFRFEDDGLTLRLFRDERDVLSMPYAKSAVRYAFGWIAMNDAGRWMDAHGVLPPNWQPSEKHLSANKV